MNISPIELQAHQRLAETGLSAAELLSLDMSDYGRVTGRPMVGHLAARVYDVEPPGRREDAPEAPQNVAQPPASASPGIDVSSLSLEDYGALRGRLGMGRSQKEGVGILNGGNSRSAEYTSAVRAQSGRTAWNGSNVTPSPAINRVFPNHDEHRDTRTVAERLSNSANMWQG